MPSFTSIVVASLLALGAIAAPSQNEKRWGGRGYCLSDRQAQQVATNFETLIASYTKDFADAVLSPDFVDTSESVNSLINGCPQGSAAVATPLLDPTFTSRAAFELGQGQQAPINVEQLGIWHSCNTVIIRWETTNTAPIVDVQPVVGIIVLETSRAPANNTVPYYINTVYSEFDSAAWLQNIQAAGFCPGATKA